MTSMNFSIQEITVPRIKEEYRKSFESSFAEGFPFSSSLQKIDQKSLLTIKKYTKLFARLLQNHPDLFREADDYIWAGVAHFILNQPKEAIEFYERAIKKNPGSERAYLSFGNALLGLNQYSEAINKYNKVLELIEEELPEARDTERHTWAYYNRAKANYELYKYHEAIHDYEEAFNINPNSRYSYYSFYWKGNALSGLGQFLQAIDSYMQALGILKKIETSPNSDISTQATNHAWILHSIGDAYRKMGDSCHQPNQQCLNIKECQVRLENYQKALEFYNSAKDIDSENFEIWQKRGKTNRQMGCYVQAKEDYERAIELCKEEHKPNLLANYASVLKVLGESEPQRADQAKRLFKVALDQCEEKLATCRGKTEDNLPDPKQVYYELEEARCYFDI